MIVPGDANASESHFAREQLELLLTEVNALALRLKRISAPGKTGQLPHAARAVLQLLQRHGPATVPALAHAHGTSRQNIQTVVNRLAMAGLARMAQNPAHKRSELVSLTESGAAILETGEGPRREMLDRLLTFASQAELVSASELIRRLGQQLQREKLPSRTPKPKHKSPDVAPEARAPQFQNFEPELPVSLL
jgi:DNA-binding MarR family transcriptional regulator